MGASVMCSAPGSKHRTGGLSNDLLHEDPLP